MGLAYDQGVIGGDQYSLGNSTGNYAPFKMCVVFSSFFSTHQCNVLAGSHEIVEAVPVCIADRHYVHAWGMHLFNTKILLCCAKPQTLSVLYAGDRLPSKTGTMISI